MTDDIMDDIFDSLSSSAQLLTDWQWVKKLKNPLFGQTLAKFYRKGVVFMSDCSI